MRSQAASASPRPTDTDSSSPAPVLPAVAAQVAELLNLRASSYKVRSGQEIVSEGKRCLSVFLINEGAAIRYRILRDGQRQILNFLLPGDFAGVTSSCFDTALFSIKTLTHTTVSPIPMTRLLGLFETHPQLAVELFSMLSSESAVLGEHLISLGRRRAAQRIAHLLLELHERLRRVGLAREQRYRLPLTQEIIGDALGLSVPYVNRVLQELRQDGLLTIRDQLVVIEDMEGLATLADFKRNYLRPTVGAVA